MKIKLRFFGVASLILLIWFAVDFMTVYEIIPHFSGIFNLIFNVIFFVVMYLIWLCATLDLFQKYDKIERIFYRILLALCLWICSTVVGGILVVWLHVKMGWQL